MIIYDKIVIHTQRPGTLLIVKKGNAVLVGNEVPNACFDLLTIYLNLNFFHAFYQLNLRLLILTA